ncbi:Uncharacterized protein PBTT_04595 [Plasmodiophora brassicae]
MQPPPPPAPAPPRSDTFRWDSWGSMAFVAILAMVGGAVVGARYRSRVFAVSDLARATAPHTEAFVRAAKSTDPKVPSSRFSEQQVWDTSLGIMDSWR